MHQMLQIMKTSAFVFFLIVFSMFAKNTYSQQKEISVNLSNTTIREAFSQIEKSSDYVFLVSDDAEKELNGRVSLDASNRTINEILDILLIKTNLGYRVVERQVSIYYDKNKKSNTFIEIDRQQQLVNTSVTGIVIDRQKKPLPGVSIKVQGTTQGTTTDANGKYILQNIPKNAFLEFSFVGMKTQIVFITTRTTIDIIMLEDGGALEELIVTGYQQIKKTRMTGAVEVLKAADIENKGYISVEDALKGTLAGVSTMSISGRPGAASQITIRGINSLNGTTDPIWIVDGMQLQGDLPSIGLGGTEFQNTVLTNGIGNISPDDIESITVLKDAAATAIYGSRAANGVIVIQTKRGTAGRTNVRVQSSYIFENAPKNKLEMMNSIQKVDFELGIYEDYPGLHIGGRAYQIMKNLNKGELNIVQANAGLEQLRSINTNWYDEIFRISHNHQHSVTLSGGNQKTTYYSSLNYLSQNGIIPNNEYKRFGANINLTHNFTDKLRIFSSVSSSIRNDRSTASVVNPLQYATYANTYERPYEDDGSWSFDRSYSSARSEMKDGYMYDFNIIKDLNENSSNTNYMNTSANLKLEYEMLKGLRYSLQGVYSNTASKGMIEVNPGSYTSKYTSWASSLYTTSEIPDNLNNGSLRESTASSQSWSIRNQFTFAKGLDNGEHYFNAVLGQEASSVIQSGYENFSPEYNPLYGTTGFPSVSGIDASALNLASLSSRYEGQSRAVSFYITGSYSLKDRYIVAASARLDGVDAISKKNQFQPLWNVSGKWNLHNETFMENLKFIDVLALRASYGYTGSIDRSALPFSTISAPMTSSANRYNGETAYQVYRPGNPDIKWERKEDRSAGIDMSLFKNKFNATINYYNNVTRDLLNTKTVAPSSGRATVVANVSSVRNAGWEVTLKTSNIQTKNFSWYTSFVFAYNKNTILEAYYKKIEQIPDFNSTSSGINSIFVEGNSARSWYGFNFAGIDPGTGNTLVYIDKKDKDGNPLGAPYKNGKYVFDLDNYTSTMGLLYYGAYNNLGLSYPPYSGGLSTSFNYKRLSASVNFIYMTGHKIRSFFRYATSNVNSSYRNLPVTELNRWRRAGDHTDVAAYSTTTTTAYLYKMLDIHLEDGHFLKCNNISVGYNFPKSLTEKIKMESSRINFNIQNIYTWSKYRGIDPETLGSFTYPSSIKFSFTLNLVF